MAKFTKELSVDDRYSIELEVKETGTSISENTSVVSYTLKATKSGGTGYHTTNKTNPVKVSLDGSEVVNKKIAYDFTGSTPKTITLASGKKTITHNADGTKTIACSGYFKDAENGRGSATASGNLTLTQLHKAPDVEITSITENISYLKTTIGLSDATFVSNVSIKTLTLTGTTYDDATITSFKVKNGNYSETTTNITNNTGSITLNFQNNPLTISPPAEGMLGNNRILLEITATDNKNASKTTTFSYSIPVVNNLQYLKPTITPTSVSAKRDGQLTGKVKLNASGTYTDKIGYASGYTTLSPTLVLEVYEHSSSTLKFSRNITTSDAEFVATSNSWTLTNLQIGIERGTSQTPPSNWFDPAIMYDLKLTIKDDVTTNAPLTPLETIANVLIGEATWTEYKDRVDFKKLTIQGVEVTPGGGGTGDYANLINKPQINGVTLSDNKTASQLGFSSVATSGSYSDLSNKPTIPTKTSDLTNDSGFVTDISNKTNTSVLPNDNGEIKTKFRISNKGYTGSGNPNWYYKLCELPTDNNGNYASAIISGRIGGWVNDNMSSISALAWNRNGTGISLLDIAGGATAMSSIWGRCDIVIYTDANPVSTTAVDNGKDIIYLKCSGYYTFDLDVELFQSTATFLYDGTYLTTTPTGTLVAQASTSNKRVEIINSKLYVAGNEMGKKSDIPIVNNGTLTIQKNGSNVQTFTANQSSNVIANIVVPTKTSDITNDSGYLTSHQSIKTINNTTMTGTGNVSVQPTLVSGTNIKTINNTSLLGSGNISITQPTKTSDLTNDSNFINENYLNDSLYYTSIYNISQSGDEFEVVDYPFRYDGPHDAYISARSVMYRDTNDAWNKLDDTLDGKQDTLVSGTNIKTINGYSILGSGNLPISGGGGTATNVQINGTSITDNGVANIRTNGTYNASSNKIATMSDLPIVNNATLTIQKNGTTVNTFSANASSNVTANITVPTNTNELTNGAGFITSSYHDSSKQDKLVSGTNIKTINNTSLLSSGNMTLLTEDDIYYKAGDIIELGDTDAFGLYVANGYITSSTKKVTMTFSVPKRLDNISSIIVNNLNVEARGISGYLNSQSGYVEYVGKSGYTITAWVSSSNSISVTIEKSSAYTNISNNTLVSIDGYIKFTLS